MNNQSSRLTTQEKMNSFLYLNYDNYNLVMEFFSFHECK